MSAEKDKYSISLKLLSELTGELQKTDLTIK
jgi:hypothetical protein